jgi:hypothetical protein
MAAKAAKKGVPYYMTPEGERMFDDEAMERKSRGKWEEYRKGGGRGYSRHRNKVKIATKQAMAPSNNSSAADRGGRGGAIHTINVEHPSGTILEERLVQMSARKPQQGDGLDDDTLLRKMDMLHTVSAKKQAVEAARLARPRSVALTKEQRAAAEKAERDRQLRRLQGNLSESRERRLRELGKPRHTGGERGGAERENVPVSLNSLLERTKRAEKNQDGVIPHAMPKPLVQSQRIASDRLSKNVPKRWQSKDPSKDPGKDPSFGGVSRIEQVGESPAKTTKGGVASPPLVPRGFEKHLQKLEKGRKIKAIKPPIKESMMLIESRQDARVVVEDDVNPFLEKRGGRGVVRRGQGGGGAEQVAAKEGERAAFDQAVDRLVELEDLLGAEGGGGAELQEEKAILEEFLLSFEAGENPAADASVNESFEAGENPAAYASVNESFEAGENPAAYASVNESFSSVDRNVTLEQLAEKTPTKA